MLNLSLLIGFLNAALYYGTVLGVSPVWKGFKLNINNYTSFPHHQMTQEDTVISNLSMIVQGQSLNGKIPFSVSEDVPHTSDDEENHPASMQFPIDNIETLKPRPDLTWLSSVGTGKENGSPNLRVRTNKKATLLRSNYNGGEKPRKDNKNVLHQLPKSYETNIIKNFKDSSSSLQDTSPRKNMLGINNSKNVLWAVRELCCSDFIKQVRNKEISSNNIEPKEYNSVTKSHDHATTWHGDDTDKADVIFHALGVSKPTKKKDEGRYDEAKSAKASQANKRLHIVTEHKEHKRKHCRKHHGKGKHVKKSKGMISFTKRSHSHKHVHRERSRTHEVYKRFPVRNHFRKTFHHGLWRLQNINAFRYSPRINRPFWISKYHLHSVI